MNYQDHSALSDVELLVAAGWRRRRAVLQLKQKGSLRAVLQDTAVAELAGRYYASSFEHGQEITSVSCVRDHFIGLLRDKEHEVFQVMFLDNRHRMIKSEGMFTGTIDGASVYPREVVKRALQLNAAAVIFAHNHPSGVPEPSDADKRITQRLTDALSLVDIRTLDHFVVGDKEVVSFAERGLL